MPGILTGRSQKVMALALLLLFLAVFLHPLLGLGHVRLPSGSSLLHFSLPAPRAALHELASAGDLVRLQSRTAQNSNRQEFFSPLLC